MAPLPIVPTLELAAPAYANELLREALVEAGAAHNFAVTEHHHLRTTPTLFAATTSFVQSVEASTLAATIDMLVAAVTAQMQHENTTSRCAHILESRATVGARTDGERAIYTASFDYSVAYVLRKTAADGTPYAYDESDAFIAQQIEEAIEGRLGSIVRLRSDGPTFSSAGSIGSSLFFVHPLTVRADLERAVVERAAAIREGCARHGAPATMYRATRRDDFAWTVDAVAIKSTVPQIGGAPA